MSGRLHRTRRLAVALAGAGVIAVAAVAVPALGASTVNETLSNFKISGASSAKAGSVTFKVKNTAGNEHELEVIRTDAKAAHLKMSYGRASSKGKVGEVEVGAHGTKTLKLKLKKGHYALICNIGNHYAMGMHKDFTVK
jgi:uncharacterized cupredoxin-like copper-binding protein